MMIKKYLHAFFIFFLCISTSFANSQKIKFGYLDQFKIFIGNSNEYISYKDTVDTVQGKFEKIKNDFSTHISNGDTLIIADGCELVFSKDSERISQVTLFSDYFSISNDSIKVGTATLLDIYNCYGGNARKLYIENENGKDKINIFYISRCGYIYSKDGIRMKDDKADVSKILFKIDYESTICEKIIITFE